MTDSEQKREYETVALLIAALSNICAAPPHKVVDLLTGYLWDETEAANIKTTTALKNLSD